MNYELIAIIMLFVILVTIQYSLNKIIEILKEIAELLNLLNMKNK
jgi:hypothetical protein